MATTALDESPVLARGRTESDLSLKKIDEEKAPADGVYEKEVPYDDESTEELEVAIIEKAEDVAVKVGSHDMVSSLNQLTPFRRLSRRKMTPLSRCGLSGQYSWDLV